MQFIRFLFFLILFCDYGLASAQPSSLMFVSVDSLKFQVYLNDTLKNSLPDDTVILENISDYYPTVKIELSNLAVQSPKIPVFLKPDFLVMFRIDFTDSVLTLEKISESKLFYTPRVKTDTLKTATFSQDSVYSVPEHTCSGAISELEFADFFTKYSEIDFDSEKVLFLINALAGHCYTSAQIRQIAGAMDSDEMRLIYCKLAYPYIVDKQNFSVVYDSFERSDTIQKMEDFLRNLK